MALRAPIDTDRIEPIAMPEFDAGDDGVVYLAHEESVAYFESEVQRHLGISGAEFIRRLDAGDYAAIYDDPRHREIGHLKMMSQVVR